MPPTLQRIHRSASPAAATASDGQTHQLSNGKSVRIDPASRAARQSKRRKDIARLKQIRGSLEELILLADAQDRLPRTANGHVPTKGAVRVEAQQLLSQLRDMIGPKKTAASKSSKTDEKKAAKSARPKKENASAHSRDSAKVKLRLSKALVRILIEFSRAGHSPDQLTERSLWKDPAIRDAAAILGITPPQLKRMVTQTDRKQRTS